MPEGVLIKMRFGPRMSDAMLEKLTPERRFSPIDIHVGARVRLRRAQLGMSQEQLGSGLGVTFQQVQKYERGANRVSASRLFDLSRVLDVNVTFFFEGLPEEIDTSQVSGRKGGVSDTAKVLASFSATVDENLAKHETLEMVRAYYRITDPKLRKSVLSLIDSLGG